MSSLSSGTISIPSTLAPEPSRRVATAGPDSSTRVPAAAESLMVRITALISCGIDDSFIECDILRDHALSVVLLDRPGATVLSHLATESFVLQKLDTSSGYAFDITNID